MKYRVPRLRAAYAGDLAITDLDGTLLMRLDVVPHGRSLAVLVQSEDGTPLATAYPRHTLTGTAVEVEVGGSLFATLTMRGPKKQGAVRVRSDAGDYDIAGDFDAWDFHILLDASPVADVAPRKTGDDTALVEISAHEEQLPLLAMVLAVDLLAGSAR
jgi:hypothetical protein